MSSLAETYLSPEEYLERERKAERKSEYFRGQVFAMAGATREHVVIVTNLVGELRQQLRGRPCDVYSTDMRLQASAAGLYTYPDVMVVCGEPAYADDHRDTLLNPNLIIEVLSESTKDYDRGQKFQHYRTLPSLREYLTIAQNNAHLERWTREDEQHWVLCEVDDLSASVRIESIGVELELREIYDRVDFTDTQPPGPETQ